MIAVSRILRAARRVFLTNLVLAISSLGAQEPFDCTRLPVERGPVVEQLNFIQQFRDPFDRWHLDRIDQPVLPLDQFIDFAGTSGEDVDIYIVDTGVDPWSPELHPRVIGGFSAFEDEFGWDDDDGHGTAVASLAAGKLSGVAPRASIYSVRVFKGRVGSTSEISAGFRWVYDQIAANPDRRAVVNHSGGGPIQSQIDREVCAIIELGAPVFIAAGNRAANACAFSPSRVLQAHVLGALNRDDFRTPYSNFGPCVDMWAPGDLVRVPTLLGTYILARGTSYAAPLAAGGAARGIDVIERRTVERVLFVGRFPFRDDFETGDLSKWTYGVGFPNDGEEIFGRKDRQPGPIRPAVEHDREALEWALAHGLHVGVVDP